VEIIILSNKQLSKASDNIRRIRSDTNPPLA